MTSFARVHEQVYDEFCERMAAIVRRMKQGAPLSSSQVSFFFGGDCAIEPRAHAKSRHHLVIFNG